MIRHYIKIAIRTLLRNKTYSTINILGLAVGIGVCLLIYQYINFELSYDRFHSNSENTFRVRLDHFQNSSLITSEVLTPHGLGSSANLSIPEIQQMVRIRPMLEDEGVVIENPYNSRKFLEYNLYYVDNAFLEMFNYSLKFGNRSIALDNINNIVLTAQTAEKYFGSSNPLGKKLRVKGGNLSGDFIVSGVLSDLPKNTHLEFDFLLPLEFMLTHYGIYTRTNGWKWYNFYTYVTLNRNTDFPSITKKFDQIMQTSIGKGLVREGIEIKTGLQKITDIHLKSNFASDLAKNSGSFENIFFYGIVGVIILIIAYLNFINLSTARAIRREKEIGVRKCLGVRKYQLVIQFLTESAIVNIIAALFGILLVYLLLPLLSQVIGEEIELTLFQSLFFLILFFAIILIGAFLSGLYPAFVLSSFKPISIFRSMIPQCGGNINLRKALVGLQFSASILLISGSYIIYEQINFMKNQDLGIDMEQIIVVPGPRVVLEEGREQLPAKYQAFKSAIKNHHSITALTGTSNIPGKGVKWYGGMRKLGDPADAAKEGKAILVDANFTDTYNFELMAGDGFTTDMKDYSAVIINEKALSVFQLGAPHAAIGQSIIMSDLDTMKIAGVVKNAHWSSLKEPLSPTIFGIAQYNAYFSIKSNLSNIPETLGHIETTFKKSFPNDPFDYFFLNDSFNRQYQADIQFGNVFAAFTLLAIFLASIGLFALVSFSASLRTKEIGIRKVLGASVSNIIMLLCKEYLLLLFMASILGFPLVMFASQAWLEGYAHRINLGVDIFLIPLVLLLFISFLTVGYRTYLSANNNPVESLRNE